VTGVDELDAAVVLLDDAAGVVLSVEHAATAAATTIRATAKWGWRFMDPFRSAGGLDDAKLSAVNGLVLAACD